MSKQESKGWGRKKAAALAAAAVVLGLAAVAAGALAAAATADPARTDRIAPGVQVAEVSVGGLTCDAAAARLREWAHTATAKPVTLVAPRSGRRWNLTLASAGGRFDVEKAVEEAYAVGRDGSWLERALVRLRGAHQEVRIEPDFHLSEETLRKRLAEIGNTIRIPARNAQARMEGGMLLVTRTERRGVRLDVEATAAALLKDGKEALRDGGTTHLVIAIEEPAVTAEALRDVTHPLGSFATRYGTSSRDRRHNVELAASHIDGTLLAPGETFSYNETVGPRSRRLGWREAPTYLDGRIVPGTGGGICQVSSTLYNAALLSGIKIVRRSHHSMPVKYVSPGRDATVAYGAIDLKFQNTTEAPVYVAARAAGGVLTLTLYGRRPATPRTVRIETSRPRPRPKGGFVVTTYRVFNGPDGAPVREVVSTDSYRPLVKAAAERPAAPRATRRPAVAKPTAPPPEPPAPEQSPV